MIENFQLSTQAFNAMDTHEQAATLVTLSLEARQTLLRFLAPDDAADVIQCFPVAEQEGLLSLLDTSARGEVAALLAYEQDVAGGNMNPHFLSVRPQMTVREAIWYLRRHIAKQPKVNTNYIYVVDPDMRLLGVVSLKEIFLTEADRHMGDVMHTDVISVTDTQHQEDMAHVFTQCRLNALPVLNEHGKIVGIVTVDDVVDVVRAEATQDIHKLGGTEALDVPYLTTSLGVMVRKRASWLVTLFLGELLTASAMGYFEVELSKAVVLALFLPLIISSGGNAGSQASTLVIRAMALGEVRIRDWWVVVRRELVSGAILGLILGAVGMVRILVWQGLFGVYGEHFILIGLTVSLSLVGVVLWGSVMGCILPFVLRLCRVDPATASTPFVATLVDVTGLVIYFTVANVVLKGTLL